MDVSLRHGLKHSLCLSVRVSRSLFQFLSFSSLFCNLNSHCLCLFRLSVFILFCAKFPRFVIYHQLVLEKFPVIIPPNTANSLSGISEYGYFILLDLVSVFVEDLACLLLQLFYVLFLLLVLFPLCLSLGNFPLTCHDNQWPTLRLCQVCRRAFWLASLFLPLCVLMSPSCSFSQFLFY